MNQEADKIELYIQQRVSENEQILRKELQDARMNEERAVNQCQLRER